jgi:hypothetical protein
MEGDSVKEKGWQGSAVAGKWDRSGEGEKSLQKCEPGVLSAVYPYVRRGEKKKICHNPAAGL